MASSFANIRQDDLNRFYTRAAVGELLVDQLGDFAPRNVLDLGVGEGSLSKAVVRRWSGMASLTVDIDPGILSALRISLEMAGAAAHRHQVGDALDYNLIENLAEHGEFDLAVCNPPFFRPSWDRAFARILQEANLAEACPSTADATAEIIFLAQNLRMLRDGGKIAIILPRRLVNRLANVVLPSVHHEKPRDRLRVAAA